MKSAFHPHAEAAVASNGLQCYAETVSYPRHPRTDPDVIMPALRAGHSEGKVSEAGHVQQG
jgi:hypothetical protein